MISLNINYNFGLGSFREIPLLHSAHPRVSHPTARGPSLSEEFSSFTREAKSVGCNSACWFASRGIPDGLVRFLHCVTALYDWRRQSSEKRGPPGRHRSTTSGIFLYLGFPVRELDSTSGKPTCRNRRGIQETFARIRECAAVISVHQPFDETDNEPRPTRAGRTRDRPLQLYFPFFVRRGEHRINYLPVPLITSWNENVPFLLLLQEKKNQRRNENHATNISFVFSHEGPRWNWPVCKIDRKS